LSPSLYQALLVLAVLSLPIRAEDWTRFRGPNGSGISSDKGFPTEFSKSKNLVWRTPVRPGKSSPVLTSRYIFLTGAEKDQLFTQCFNRETGKLLWERTEVRMYKKDGNLLNHAAAITPVTDGENVYSFFRDFGLISYDGVGNLRWKVQLGPFINIAGMSASPILAENSIIVLADQIRGSYIAAFDRRSGEMRWKAARKETESWTTPLLYDSPCSNPLIITAAGGQYGAHSVSDGKRVLTKLGSSQAVVASPVLSGGIIYAFGYGLDDKSSFVAYLAQLDKNHDGQISPDEYLNAPEDPDHLTAGILSVIGDSMGNGDGTVTKEKFDAVRRELTGPSRLLAMRLNCESGAQKGDPNFHEIWRYQKSFDGVVPSPLVYDGVVYLIKSGGILTALDGLTGRVLKIGRVRGALGGYSASPVAADGKVYLANEEGKVAVLKAGRDWELLAVNDLGEGTYATPALSEGRIYLRTDDALYCIGISHR